MGEHERTNKSKHDETEQKNRSKQQEDLSVFDYYLPWNQDRLSIGGTSFLPPMDEHAKLLAASSSDEARANLVSNLQQTYGNRYVQRLLNSKGIQARFNTNPHDVYEQEADSVSDGGNRTAVSQLQRQETDEEEVLQARPSDIQRVGVGENPPELSTLKTARSLPQMTLEQKRNVNKEVIRKKKMAAFREAFTKFSQRPGNEILTIASATEAVNSYKTAIDATADPEAAYLRAFNEVSTKGKWVVNELVEHMRNFSNFVEACRVLYPDITVTPQLPGEKVGKIPDEEKRKKFAAALKSMPGFKQLIYSVKHPKMHKVKQFFKRGSKTEVNWKDGGLLTANIEEKIDPGVALLRTDFDSGKFSKKVKQADDFFKRLVEPELLSTIPRPKIVVHLRQSLDAAKTDAERLASHRAYYAAGEVHIGQDAFRETIIHEIGHHIEENLSTETWQKIQLLMRGRHAEAGGGTTGGTAFGEARYKGEYPATGEYTSRAYEGTGATEVMSMTVQYLSEPGKIEATLITDPQQVGVIVRALRPKEYAQHDALREFDELLP